MSNAWYRHLNSVKGKIMKEIYLDNSATTALSDGVKKRMTEVMEIYGNPSSLHLIGNRSAEVLDIARRQVAMSIGVTRPEPGELIFTSCGSEADNLAIIGTALAKPRRRGGRIITTDSEHPGVANALRYLEGQGFDIVRIPTKGGELDFDRYASSLNDKTFLVTMMLVNNETGAMYDVKRAFTMAKNRNPDIVTHTDAVQGYLKTHLTPKSLKADLLTVSAHKIHGPKGVGALYVSKDCLRRRDLIPLLMGGGQESGFRSGTENLIGIAGFGQASAEGYAKLEDNLGKLSSLRELTLKKLSSLPIRANIPNGKFAPHILNYTLPNIKSETMVHALSAKGICVSNGSACSSHNRHLSESLLAFGLTPDEVECSIRISFSEYNTLSDVDALAVALGEELEHLVRRK